MMTEPGQDRRSLRRVVVTSPGIALALVLLFTSLALVGTADLLGGRALVGAADSDAIRGAWSMDQAAHGWPAPLTSGRVAAPGGAQVLPLPWASSLLLAPVNLLRGPITGYNVSLVLLLAALGMATAWLVRELCGSWLLGGVAGGAVLAQPMLMHAARDGTPEHLSLWALPAALALTVRALRGPSWRSGLAAGAMVLVASLDSPYSLVYLSVLMPTAVVVSVASLIRPRDPVGTRRAGILWALAVALAVALAAGAYGMFSLESTKGMMDQARMLAGNSVDLTSWWTLENRPASDYLGNMAPALIPTVFLVGAVILGLMGLPRSLPWLLAGLACLAFALGTNTRNPGVLGWWGGSAAAGLGEGVLGVNQWLSSVPGFEGIRFPRRWLVPSSLALAVAGALGLASLGRLAARLPVVSARRPRWLPWLAGPAAALVAALLVAAQPFRDPLPRMELPEVAFARWIAERPGGGAVVALPTRRPAPADSFRSSVPVFADLPSVLASADCQFFQLVHRRPTWCRPALMTLSPRGQLPRAAARLMGDLDDLALPGLEGREPPASAMEDQGRDERREGRDWLVAMGIRWFVLDLGVYHGEHLERARGFLEPLAEEQRFDDGVGALVLELTAPGG